MLMRFCSFWIFPLAACALLSLTIIREPGRRIFELAWLVPLGVLFWTLLEYCLHRFLFHWHSRSRRIKQLLHQLHLSHHQSPRDPDRILVRPLYSLSASALLLVTLYAMLGSLYFAAGLLSGMWLGFLYYEFVHYRVHLSASTWGLLVYQRRRHFYHHFVDSENCFGVTSPLWDVIFRTFRRLSD